MATVDRHPDAERLAEYVEGLLAEAARRDVELHLSTCASCRTVVAETLALEAMASKLEPAVSPTTIGSSRRIWTKRAIGLAAAAAIVLAIVMARPSSWHEGRGAEVAELVAALAKEPTRPVEGRLTGGFVYAPLAPQTRGATAGNVSPDVRIAAARLEKAAGANTPENQAALGAAYLATGEIDRAITALRAAATARPEEPRYLSDLSVAYMASARDLSREEDWPKALASTERALRISPSLPEALYNRAVILDHLHLDDAARDAWKAYLARDPDSPWARHVPPTNRPQSSRWDRERQRMFGAATVDGAALQGLADDYPEELETYLEDELLPTCAGPASLLCHRVADALYARTHDRFPIDLIDATWHAPVEAIGAWRQGREMYEANRIVEAGASFRAAAEKLPGGHPLLEWVLFYQAVGAYYQRDLAGAGALLERVRLLSESREHIVLGARVEWMTGLIAGVRGDFSQALARYERAEAQFAAANCPEQLAKVHDLMADVNGYLGDDHAVWHNRLASLASLDRLSNHRWRQSILETAAARALREGYPEAGLPFQQAVVAAARQTGEPVAMTEALIYRSRILRQLGRLTEASADLREAERWRSRVGPPVDRSLDIDIALESTALHLPEGPDALSRSIQFAQAHDLNARLPYLLVARATDLHLRGNEREAEQELHQALNLAQQLAFAASPQHEVGQLDEFSDAARRLIEWQLSSGRSDEALATLEWTRAPLLRHALGAPALAPADEGFAPTAATVRLYYQPFGGSIAVWRVDRRGHSSYRLTVGAATIERQLAEYDICLFDDAFAARRDMLGRTLYDELLAPVLNNVADGDGLELIVEGKLSDVPFASLITPAYHYVIQDRPIVYVPSASISAALRSVQPPASARLRLLVVAGGASSAQSGLPAAAQEIDQVAAAYEQPSILSGATATPKAFREQASDYDVIHFAGHAMPNAQFPELSKLLLRSADAGGQPYLFAREIAALRLTRRPTVVLAACETNRGAASDGEGLLSLARAFLAAGARDVVATNWRVDDEPTLPLMASFHGFLRAGGDPARALQRAQIAQIAVGMSPKEWAAFAVIGPLGAARRR